MEIKYNIEKSERKALAQKIAEIIGAEVEYLGVPSCAYQIDIFTLRKDSVLSFTDHSDTEIVEKVLDGLAEAGYTSETVTYPEARRLMWKNPPIRRMPERARLNAMRIPTRTMSRKLKQTVSRLR